MCELTAHRIAVEENRPVEMDVRPGLVLSPATRRPAVLLSYFALRDVGVLLDAVRRSGLAGRAAVYVGSYGVNPRAANPIHEEGCLYAPMLALRNVAPSPLPRTAAGRVAAVQSRRSSRRSLRRRWRRSTPTPNHTSAPTSAAKRVSNQTGHVKSQNRNLTVTSSVFWAMKVPSAATPEIDAMAHPRVAHLPPRPRCSCRHRRFAGP